MAEGCARYSLILDRRKRDHARCLLFYRTWINGSGAHPLNVILFLEDYYGSVQAVFQDFVLPFRIQLLTIRLKFKRLPQLSNLPVLDVKKLAISLGDGSMRCSRRCIFLGIRYPICRPSRFRHLCPPCSTSSNKHHHRRGAV